MFSRGETVVESAKPWIFVADPDDLVFSYRDDIRVSRYGHIELLLSRISFHLLRMVG